MNKERGQELSAVKTSPPDSPIIKFEIINSYKELACILRKQHFGQFHNTFLLTFTFSLDQPFLKS